METGAGARLWKGGQEAQGRGGTDWAGVAAGKVGGTTDCVLREMELGKPAQR